MQFTYNHFQPIYPNETIRNQNKQESTVPEIELGNKSETDEPSSIENMVLSSRATHDIADMMSGDKLRWHRAASSLLRKQIKSRYEIYKNIITNLDYRIVQCESYQLQLESIPMFANPLVESKRANLSNMVNKMESEKTDEIRKHWSDQVKLYSELLNVLGEYQSSLRRSQILGVVK